MEGRKLSLQLRKSRTKRRGVGVVGSMEVRMLDQHCVVIVLSKRYVILGCFNEGRVEQVR